MVDHFDLMKYFKLQHQIIGALWDDSKVQWSIEVKNLQTGTIFTDTADVFINGGGILK